ncbi:Imm26 family immunity protein [Lysinibacillus sp. CTST325]
MKTSKSKFQVGDIFSLKLDNHEYAFGRCISQISLGHIVEIFDYFSEEIIFDTNITEKRLFEPIPIDTWGLFGKRKKEGIWKVIGHEDSFKPENVDYLRYWGMAAEKVTDTKLLGVFDNDCGNIEYSIVNGDEHRIQSGGLHFKIKGRKNEVFLLRSPWGDIQVKEEIKKYRQDISESVGC